MPGTLASKIFESSHEFTPRYQRRVGILILGCAILAMVLANIFKENYTDVLSSTSFFFNWPWMKFIDKGLMSIFFFAAGMEIRHELFHGHLTKPETRKVPVYCAIGGVVVPLVLMALFAGVTTAFSETNGSEIFGGLPIPVATDIVFALAFLSFFSNRVPKSLRAFVLAFAVIDDLIGLCMVFVLQGTISPTAVAVVIGFLIPVHVGTFQLRAHLLAKLLIVNSFIVLPLFALANGGISFAGVSANDIISEPLFWAIITAQFFGKVLGIYGVSLYAIKSPKLSIPWGCDKRHMFLASGVASIGFTLSIFLAKVAFENDTSSLLVAKLAVVVASVIAVVFSSILVFRLPEATQKSSIQI